MTLSVFSNTKAVFLGEIKHGKKNPEGFAAHIYLKLETPN